MQFNYLLKYLFLKLACCTATFAASSAQADDPLVIQSYIAEREIIQTLDLTSQWWQWVYGIPKAQNPTLDLTGIHCAAQQSGKVWFLANSDSRQTVERHCEIPADTSIFFPIINNVTYTPPSVEQTCDSVKDLALFEKNPNYVVTVKLDGSSIELDERNLIGSSVCFDLLAKVPSEINPPSYYPSATDGYWFMFNPLPAGSHELELLAQYHDTAKNEFRTMVHVRYKLIVQDQ